MSFGFSIGDFVTIGTLAVKAYACLQNSTGSRADYQSLKLIRDSLGATLAEAGQQITKSRSLPTSLTNAIKEHLTCCHQALRAFDEITGKFTASFSAGGSGKKMKDTYRKIEWSTTKAGIRELFGDFQKHIDAIQLLLVVGKVQCLERIDERIENISTTLQRIEKSKDIPKTIGWSPDYKPIMFIDALDRRVELPYEWCVTWPAFCDIIKSGFRRDPESVWVNKGLFEVLNEGENGALITKESWENILQPGMQLSMAMLLMKQKSRHQIPGEQSCPACETPYKGYGKCKDLERVRCAKCGTWFQVSSEPRIRELSEDSIAGNPTKEKSDTGTTKTNNNRIRRWHVVQEASSPALLPQEEELADLPELDALFQGLPELRARPLRALILPEEKALRVRKHLFERSLENYLESKRAWEEQIRAREQEELPQSRAESN